MCDESVPTAGAACEGCAMSDVAVDQEASRRLASRGAADLVDRTQARFSRRSASTEIRMSRLAPGLHRQVVRGAALEDYEPDLADALASVRAAD